MEAERRAAAQAVTADIAEGAAAEPVSPTYGGIQPYSGSTTVAQPLLEVDNNPITGTDSGSLILRVQQLEVLASEFRVWRVDNQVKLPQPIVGIGCVTPKWII